MASFGSPVGQEGKKRLERGNILWVNDWLDLLVRKMMPERKNVAVTR